MKKDFKKLKRHDDLDRRTNNLKEFKKLAEFLKDFRYGNEEPELTAVKMEELFEKKWKELN
jgi:hypothetical protein